MFERTILVHYHEIGLKGRNRSTFEQRLRANLAFATRDLGVEDVERIASRLRVPVPEGVSAEDVAARAAHVPGVVHVGVAYVTARDVDEFCAAALLAMAEVPDATSFRVDARRSATDFAVKSMDVNRIVGQAIVDATGKRVDLSRPDVTVYIEVVQGAAYVFARRIPGPGGLPVGVSGKVCCLLSAGIDSPVAAWRLAKRGAVVVGVHFSGRPQTDDLSERYAELIGEALECYGGLGRLYFVPFGDLQRQVALESPPDLRVLLYRRLMVRVAEAIAAEEGARALVTGESLGQVASQTLENIVAVDEAATMPILRPLIGMDKLEITAEARGIGTYEHSTAPHSDCCTLFMPKRPATHATVAEVRAGEEGLDLDAMVAEALGAMCWRDYACEPYRAPARWRGATDGGR